MLALVILWLENSALGNEGQDVGQLLLVGGRLAHPEDGEDQEHAEQQESGDDLMAPVVQERRRLAGGGPAGLVGPGGTAVGPVAALLAVWVETQELGHDGLLILVRGKDIPSFGTEGKGPLEGWT